MTYALLIWPHANIRYTASLQKLAQNELVCVMHSLGISVEPRVETLGGAIFLLFESDELPQSAFRQLCMHSSLYMLAEKDGCFLKPLAFDNPWVLDGDVAELLKYKGKTNASFTMMMINCAYAASLFNQQEHPLTIMDPLCGKGTTLFCAMRRGDNAIGVDSSKKLVKEGADFFEKYLQYHRLKHERTQSSLTLPDKINATKTHFKFSAVHMKTSQTLDFINGDTIYASYYAKPETVHLIITDLPYGIQHAPNGHVKAQGFIPLLRQSLPGWKCALKTGGALCMAYNTFTLRRTEVIHVLRNEGFTISDDSLYGHFDHYVEQAVNRDLIIATK
jgi:hypothetical protein